MLGRIFDRIAALPVAAKVALGVAVLIALGLAVVLSPVLVVVAALVLVVAVIACVIQLLRHASPNRWGIVAGASLVLVLLFSGISNAFTAAEGKSKPLHRSPGKRRDRHRIGNPPPSRSRDRHRKRSLLPSQSLPPSRSRPPRPRTPR